MQDASQRSTGFVARQTIAFVLGPRAPSATPSATKRTSAIPGWQSEASKQIPEGGGLTQFYLHEVPATRSGIHSQSDSAALIKLAQEVGAVRWCLLFVALDVTWRVEALKPRRGWLVERNIQ
jgi:hypothetical protein